MRFSGNYLSKRQAEPILAKCLKWKGKLTPILFQAMSIFAAYHDGGAGTEQMVSSVKTCPES